MARLLIRLEWFIGLVLIQGLVLNHVNIYGLFTPAIYIYFVMSLNTLTGRKSMLMWAFCLGLSVDIMSNTPGLNASATLLIAYFRKIFIRSQTLREISENFQPDSRTMGSGAFFRYSLSITFIHALLIGLFDAFSWNNFGMIVLKALSDSAITTLCIICLDRMRRK